VFECLTEETLFEESNMPTQLVNDVHLQKIARFIGPFHPDFLERSSKRSEFFDEKGKS